MRLVPIGVAVVAAALFLASLGVAPFVDPPEGAHAEIAREMLARGDFVTPRLDGVRHLEGPPLLHWLIALSSVVAGGPTPLAARVWPALASVGVAALTAWIGRLLGGPRVGLLAGLMVAANLGVFVFGRLARPDLVFVLCVTLAHTGFVLAYLGRGRWPLALFYAGLGLAALVRDLPVALGPLVVVGVFLRVTRERPLRAWLPWWGIALFGALALPWYALVELRNRGILWHTIVDDHLLAFARHRVPAEEDVALGAAAFLVVTLVAFLPWALAVPAGVGGILRTPRVSATDRLWLLLASWAAVVLGVFTLAPHRLPQDGLAAFPALALVAARGWDDTMAGASGAARPRALLVPVLLAFLAVSALLGAVWARALPLPRTALDVVATTDRGLTAPGATGPVVPVAALAPLIRTATLVFLMGSAALAVATWRRTAAAGLAVALATVLGFLPVAGNGVAELARARSARPIAEALAARAEPGDLVLHEGPVESSGSLLLTLPLPVPVVDGLAPGSARAATLPEARDVFWDAARAREAWAGPGRHFLVSVVPAGRSVVRALPPERVRLVAEAGGRRLYASEAGPR